MAIARLVRQAKRPHGLWVKMAAVTVLGLCFIFVWAVFSSSSSSVTSQRESFEDIAEPVSSSPNKAQKLRDEFKKGESQNNNKNEESSRSSATHPHSEQHKGSDGNKDKKKVRKEDKDKGNHHRGVEDPQHGHEEKDKEKEKEEEKGEEEGEEERVDRESEVDVDVDVDVDGGGDLAESVDQEDGAVEEELRKPSKGKVKGPLFDPNASYRWKLCSSRSKHNYIPCIDIEVGGGKVLSYRHTERSCPRTPLMCLVPLPHEGYGFPLPWPQSIFKILYKNVAHPKLAAYIKRHNWLMESGEYLTFPQNQSEFKGGIQHYLESIEEMVPDIEWGKNIRVVLDIGCTDSSLAAALLDKEVLTLSLGLKNDLVDLAQVALERGFPAVISPFSRRRLPFPSQVFDAIHCGGCNIPWHSNGGRLLLEMNRILRPGGYFIMSSKHDSIEEEEAMTTLTASICWNVLAHKSDDVGEVGVKIYQKPEGNDIYELRRKKIPPLCKENENPDATCLHSIPSGIEQHGAEWPEEWPKRLESYPDWVNNKEKVVADTNHWNAVVNKSYLNGLGINWTSIRNVMDMKSIYGGLAVALSQQKVWVMNVVPVHAPDTLPIIFERGFFGVYHDWCESFATYPRTYDLLHADHLFSRLKNRCKQPVTIVVEMDRILRPGGWTIIRDKVEILNPLEEILKSMQWEIRMTFAQDKEVPARLTLLALFSATTFYCLYKSRRLRHLKLSLYPNHNPNPNPNPKPKILFLSETGTAKSLAVRLHRLLASNDVAFDLVDSQHYEPEDLPKETLLLLVASTWQDGGPPAASRFFATWLADASADFRAGSLLLSRCAFAVFGVGSRAYGNEAFNAVARGLATHLRALGAKEVVPLCEGDVDGDDVDAVFNRWCEKVVAVLKDGGGVVEDGDDVVAGECGVVSSSEEDSDVESSEIVDLEDIAGKAPSRKSVANGEESNGKLNGRREMVTPVIRANLQKQGYKIIGSHSGVKICRWTKAQLRGRGGCYKHSFYGIESHRCMEATPSLACANKCVFCWRHHTNPVGKSWQWQMDDPIEIVNSAIDLHTNMIKQMKGVPGVTLERLNEGLSPRHCALSLVGEPIMYPEINALVDELHKRRISTFLVTNAQFPEKIKSLKPITQLYVSVDAATKDSLKAIDRPLFGDFWERFIDSLTALRQKHQRTVYRLTLVKGWNTEDVEAYSKLFSIGEPDFVEIKGVTYCGSSTTSKLTMENVPWHTDVKAFSEALALKSQGEYEVACEHAHSCCVLLAKANKFKIDGQWYTWIDYEKFHDLVASGRTFDSRDYMSATPSWALYGSEEGGFDPGQLRYRKERHHKSNRNQSGLSVGFM
ncbi:S-adenosyl-L-methionine-dependent tRNA 4-demethylwyosine synthase, partial [Mucuna pruriens]